MMWSAFADYAEVLREERENVKFLPGVKLPKNLRITSSLKEAVDFGDAVAVLLQVAVVGRPALRGLDVRNDAVVARIRLEAAFCHQQASPFMRKARSAFQASFQRNRPAEHARVRR